MTGDRGSQETLTAYTAPDRGDGVSRERVDELEDRVDELEEIVVDTLAQLGEKLDRIEGDRGDGGQLDHGADREGVDFDVDGGEGDRTTDQIRGYQ